ncbi:hypothetical protein [Clostridium sp. CF012]|uniref:hypothetical protein n=1 Tax=Clostridium sp. CF012 TaxID=2843319 RepID=UPI001C0CB0E3|nr:hypothetical protein [Clostridium sp. CF012]MBU3142388.1 hypothetical protein [Clostridium sp. CF012]
MARYRLPLLKIFPDCSGLSERGRCIWLTISECQGEECTFKRTCKEDFDSIQYAYQRLSSLSSSTQRHIAEKYYGGFMPWNEEESASTYRVYNHLGYSQDKISD